MRTDQDLIPKGLRAESLSIHRGRVEISVAPVAQSARCPVCGHPSRRVHSRYVRTIADLPWHGTPVVFRARVRRFFCDEGPCERKIFCERLPEVAAHSRKSSRLDDALLLIAFELGGRAGARLAAELRLLISRDALLRRLRGSPVKLVGEVRVLSVDDWASRKGEKYGTILVDLERRRVVDLLPDRSADTLAGWLEEHPGVEVVSRDRYRPYIEGASVGAPDAVQVADRFHVFKNLYDAVEKLVERNRRRLGKSDDGPDATPPAETRPRSGHPGWGHRANPEKREERRERYGRVVELRERGMYVEDIASEVGLHQRTVVAWLNAGGFPERETEEEETGPGGPLCRVPGAPLGGAVHQHGATVQGDKRAGLRGLLRRCGRPPPVPAQRRRTTDLVVARRSMLASPGTGAGEAPLGNTRYRAKAGKGSLSEME